MKNRTKLLSNIPRAGFIRSVITRVLAIFIAVSVVITAVAFISFTSEIRKNILLDRQKRLDSVENTISGRMEEITSIAYNIGTDSEFYFESIESDPTAGIEMAKMLKRYLVGNGFIKHLAYCRTSEPDTIYTSTGERSLSDFLTLSFGLSKEKADSLISAIHSKAQTAIHIYGSGDNACFAYLYPLPQLSEKPLAHVLMLVPLSEVEPLFDSLLTNTNGRAFVCDADGEEIFGMGNLDEELDLSEYVKNGEAEEDYKSESGEKYVLQKTTSQSNGWTYVSVMRKSDTLSGLANKQLAFIVLVLLLLVIAIVAMLTSIIAQYRPISNLAEQVAQKKPDVDERALLSSTLATLKDDSEQKQKFENAFYEAEAASKAKSAFLSNMSHDIRTPMNAIIGMTAIALKHKDDPVYVEECLKKVQVSSDYLLDIINNVLDMSRIESGRIPISEDVVVIPALIDSVVSLMTSSIEAKYQTLSVNIDDLRQVAVLGDNIHIVQVFVNILSNAVKFTPEGGKITLGVRQVDSDDTKYGNYIFTFSDTGIGISPEFIDRVFDTFSRADEPVASQIEGTGLGMAIAQKLVELMGGTISCESEQGKGTTFTVTMHMKLADEKEAMSLISSLGNPRADHADSEDEIIALGGKRILLVEDNAMNREIARRILSETGAEIVEANNGKEAVELFSAKPEDYFDLIFMDIQMPVMNGYDATRAIRSMSRTDAPSIPIYAMTANTFDEDVRQVKAAGMNGHIGKPYNPTTLYKTLAQVFGE